MASTWHTPCLRARCTSTRAAAALSWFGSAQFREFDMVSTARGYPPFQNHGMKTPLVAIADDDVAFANYLKIFLEGRGYNTRIYHHGEDLVGAVQRGEIPDVV